VVKTGKTTVLDADQARTLLDSIDVSTLIGLRDRALIALMTYSFARVSAGMAMDVEDYHPKGKRWWVRLHEKGGKRRVSRTHRLSKEVWCCTRDEGRPSRSAVRCRPQTAASCGRQERNRCGHSTLATRPA
jgi:site-specific recombinase XerC